MPKSIIQNNFCKTTRSYLYAIDYSSLLLCSHKKSGDGGGWGVGGGVWGVGGGVEKKKDKANIPTEMNSQL